MLSGYYRFLAVLVLIAWVASIVILLGFAKDKGYAKGVAGSLPLIFIGLFASPVVLALLVIAIPEGYSEDEQDDPEDKIVVRDDEQREPDYGIIGGIRG